MKSLDLAKVIDDFVNSNERSLLIDGPWGCGKTYQIKEFIKNIKKKKRSITYLSLFGKESVDEVNTELYREVEYKKVRRRELTSLGLSLISKVISPFPLIGKAHGAVNAIEFAIKDLSKKEISKNIVVVFDDLERVDKKLSYISLLGYMNSLFLSQVRIICVCSSKNIENEKINDFQDFKEKIFDRVYVIDKTNKEIFLSYFSAYHVQGLVAIIDEFKNNLRHAQRVAVFYGDIVNYANENKYNLSEKIADLQLIRSCNQAINICMNKNEKPVFDSADESSLSKRLYEIDVKSVGENIANGLSNLLRKKDSVINYDPTLLAYSERIIKSLIDVFLFIDYTGFDTIFKSINKSGLEEDILNSNIFNLSDENKTNYVKEFLARLNTRTITFDDINNKRFADILHYTDYEFSDEDMEKIITLMFEDSTDEENDFMGKEVNTMFLDSGSDRKNSERVNKWKTEIEMMRRKGIVKSCIDKFKNSHDSKIFVGMVQFLENLYSRSDTRDNDEIIDFIVKNDFLLPDLSGNISDTDWQYAHAMARYSNRISKKKDFIDVAIKTCKQQPDNKSLMQRFEALIYYNIDNRFDFKESLVTRPHID